MTQEYVMEYKPTFKDKLRIIYEKDMGVSRPGTREQATIEFNTLEELSQIRDKFYRGREGKIYHRIGWTHIFSDEAYVEYANLVLEEAKKYVGDNIKVYFCNHETIAFEKLNDPS